MGTLVRIASRSRNLASRLTTSQKPAPNCKTNVSSLLPSPPSTRALPFSSRVVSALGSVDSLLPLHSATANARLRSAIGVDASYWSFLSYGLATPL